MLDFELGSFCAELLNEGKLETLSWVCVYKKNTRFIWWQSSLENVAVVKMMPVKDYGRTVKSEKNPGEEKTLGALSISGSGTCSFHKQRI